MLIVDDFKKSGYKAYPKYIGTSCDYILQKCFDDDTGKRYFITVKVYENPDGISFAPEIQFSETPKNKNTVVNTELIIDSLMQVQDIEELVNNLWLALGKPYYSYYE